MFAGLPLRARAQDGYWIRLSRNAMACRFEVTLASEDAAWVPAARAALDGVDAIEDRLSLFRESSDLVRVNRAAADGAVSVDVDLFRVLSLAAEIHRDTGGAFDITSAPLSRCWGFLQREGRLPPSQAIAEARLNTGFEHVQFNCAARTVRFKRPGMELNLGAIGKGYALDRVGAGMRQSGVACGLLSAGRSSILALGGRGGGWQVDVVSPRTRGPLARIFLRDAAIGTSGSGEQFVIVDGVRYGHVLDPRTGWPASGVLSATVIASSSAVADALSTAFLVGGPRLAHEYCRSHPGVMALITPDNARQTILVGHHPGALVEEA
jgi:thiamine biosynthesis lipoprotein